MKRVDLNVEVCTCFLSVGAKGSRNDELVEELSVAVSSSLGDRASHTCIHSLSIAVREWFAVDALGHG